MPAPFGDFEPKKVVPAEKETANETGTDSHYFVDAKGYLCRYAGGIHWFVAGLFIVADMAGAGIVALPTATVRSRKQLSYLGIKN